MEKEFNLKKEKQKIYNSWAYHGLSVVDMIKKIKELDKEFIRLLKEKINSMDNTDPPFAPKKGYKSWISPLVLKGEIDKLAGEKLAGKPINLGRYKERS